MRLHESLRPLAACAFLSFAAASFAPVAAQCGTTVGSTVFSTTWTVQGSPYCVVQDLQIGDLTIEPGVEVLVSPGVTISVVTDVQALGTRAEPIVFRAADPAAGAWAGLEFVGPVPAGAVSVLTHCVVTEAADSGIRIVDNPQVDLRSCSLRGNSTLASGGGLSVSLSAGVLVVSDCEITGNSARFNGGGVSAQLSSQAALVLDGCLVSDNEANDAADRGTFLGGGIHLEGDAVLSNCLVADNIVATSTCGGTVIARGGGVYSGSGDLIVTNSIVMENLCLASTVSSTCGSQAGFSEGGGIYFGDAAGSMGLYNTVVAGNTTGGTGRNTTAISSGVHTLSSTTLLENCTVAHNSNEGVWNAGTGLFIENSILYFNATSAIVGTATVNYSNVQGGIVGGVGNIDFNPAFVGPGDEPEHFALLPFSACIDAGNPAVQFDDACFPPSRGTARNDIGTLGGPRACDFVAPCQVVCAGRTYGDLRLGDNTLLLDWTFLDTQAPFSGLLSASNGTPGAAAFLLLSLAPDDEPLGGLTALVDFGASLVTVPVVMDGSGSFAFQTRLQRPVLAGVPVFAQLVEFPGGSMAASNGVRLSACF